MKLIEAIHQTVQARRSERRPHEIGIQGMTVTEVKGFGRQKGTRKPTAARSTPLNSCPRSKLKWR